MVFAFLPPGQKVLMIPDLKISPGLQQMIDLNRGQVRALGTLYVVTPRWSEGLFVKINCCRHKHDWDHWVLTNQIKDQS